MPNPTDSTVRSDVVDLLTADHRAVERLFDEIQSLDPSDTESKKRRKHLAERVTIELVKHSVAEEAVVYPRIAEKVDAAEADRLRLEQADAELTLKALEKLDSDDPDFDREFSTLVRQITEHVAEEEKDAFPRLREVLTLDELVELGARVQRVKDLAPTRPHPAAPDTPPGDLLLGPVTGLFDRLRDVVTGRGITS
jgi:hemerythrin superfamily protein